MANHKVCLYTRTSSHGRQPAGQNVVYAPGTTFQIRYKDKDKRIWKTLSAATYQEAVVQAKEMELSLFRQDSANYKSSAGGSNRIEPKPAFVEAVAVPLAPPPDARDTLGQAITDYMKTSTVLRRPTTVRCYTNLFGQFYACVTVGGTKARSIKSISDDDLVDFYSYLAKLGNSESTRHSKLTIVQCLLRANKNAAKLKTEYEIKVVMSYRPDEIQRYLPSRPKRKNCCFNFFSTLAEGKWKLRRPHGIRLTLYAAASLSVRPRARRRGSFRFPRIWSRS